MTASPGRTLAGALLALGVGVLLFFVVLGTAPSGSDRTVGTRAWVYRVDTLADDGSWDVREWAVAHGPRRAGVMQTHERTCRREAPTHTCRATVEARFTDVKSATDHRGALCRRYFQRTGHRPGGMARC